MIIFMVAEQYRIKAARKWVENSWMLKLEIILILFITEVEKHNHKRRAFNLIMLNILIILQYFVEQLLHNLLSSLSHV